MIYLAQDIPTEIGTWEAPTPIGFSDIHTLLTHSMNWILGIVGAIAVIAIIYAGFMYLTSAGDSAQAESAKKNFTWAMIGLVLIALSAVIVRVVNDIINSSTPH